ncbi:MAG TPA: deoxyribonuclease IV [Candidatus Onthousia faecipullorum]|uniref:Probable endonuclease 4 n=1 Tax=Candidatus Onthousia faecipullorum TaxID=2840887 RepID=A0A9D1GBM7_9FIRM|nr:deoxyribonuclease IV [Candidatus Onthousia faecipullorum]
MLIIGSHVGYKKDSGLVGSVEEALSYGANTFMLYTGAPQNTIRSSINLDNVKKAYSLMKDNGIDKDNVIVHAPYIINLANGDLSKFNFSCNFLSEELKRVDTFGFKYLVLHPGSHVGLGVDVGISNIVKALNLVLDKDNSDVMILLETMAGKGSEVGRCFEEIKTIIDGVSKKGRIGVCLDTCHLNDAGYDLNNFNDILDLFDKIIGIDKIKCIHINDSKNILGSHKDRHENIGKGTIGLDTLIKIIDCDKLKDVPKILETPYIDGHAPYKEEISLIRSLSKQ